MTPKERKRAESDYRESKRKQAAPPEVGGDTLLGRLTEVTNELCADYPNIESVEPWERLYALEQSYRGIDAATDDLHAVIEKLRIRCGITKEEVADLGWPNTKAIPQPTTLA